METGLLFREKNFYFQYFAKPERYSQYLPFLENMINSFDIIEVLEKNNAEQLVQTYNSIIVNGTPSIDFNSIGNTYYFSHN